jgi:two-component system NtrC family sensor kinase
MLQASRKILLQMLFLFLMANSYSQQQKLEDSLRKVIAQNKKDTNEVIALTTLGMMTRNADSIVLCLHQLQELSKTSKYQKGEALGKCLEHKLRYSEGNISAAIQSATEALRIYENLEDNTGIATMHLLLQGAYRDGVKDYSKAQTHALYGLYVAEKNNVRGLIIFYGQRLAPLFMAEIGQTYVLVNRLDSALYYTKRSIDYNEQFAGASWAFPYYLLATIQRIQGNYKSALENYRLSRVLTIQNDIPRDTIQINSGISTLYINIGELDSAKYYAKNVIRSWNWESETKNLLEAVSNLGQVYKRRGEMDSALKYTELKHALEDSIYSENKRRDVQNIAFEEQLKEQELEAARAGYQSRLQKLALGGGLLALLLVSGILWRNNRNKQKSYAILEKQKQETEREKAKAEQTLEKLKATQAQLIQSEKMASLGELTAGIAHEIQNPLNFVNNFSEVNTELINEMKKEISGGNYPEVKNLADNLEGNMEKITLHGKRADAIVKSMLQHSRASSGQKEPTDINALADEYLRLSYHGIRARDKSFNAALHTDFDDSISNINIIPQDIGRVLLNIYNNAFYAVAERKREQPEGYDPKVIVTTTKRSDCLEVSISDNGNGIPGKMLDKIFQPFFTTKAAGEGTGLGLSLSYDIVKAHGGEIEVKSKEGEGTTFIISLPV